MTTPKLPDELLLRYSEACAQDQRRPASAVRDAVRAHAAMLIRAQASPASPSTTHARPAANQSRWKLSLLASVALVGLTTLLVVQFDRGTPDEQELALGRPHTNSRLPDPVPATGQSSGIVNGTGGSGGNRGSSLPTLPQGQGNQVMVPNHLSAGSGSLNSANTQPAPPVAPQPRAATVEKSLDAARPAAPANRPRADAVPPAKPSTISVSPSSAAAPTPAPALAEPAVQPLQRPDAAPAPARVMGAVQASGAGTTSANTAQRAAKALAAPEAANASGQQLEQTELQMKRSEQHSDKDAASTKALNTSLLDSARSGQLAELERLLQQGARINATDAAGRTPLILAAMNGHTATVARLLALGANPALTDRDGLNALQHARQLGWTQIANLLEAGP